MSSSSPGGITAIFNQAIADHQAGRLGEARTGYQKVLDALPKHFDAKHLIGVVALQTGQLDDARKLIAEATTLNPNSAPAWNNLGNVHLREEHLDEALKCFTRAIRLQPGYGDAHLNAGNVLRRKGRLSDAAAHLRRAASLSNRSFQAHSNLGAVLLDLGDPKGALRSFEVALKLAGDQADAHANHAAALAAVGELEKALDASDRALTLGAKSTAALTTRGTVLARLGRYEEARESFERVVEIEPESAMAHCNLGALLHDAGQSKQALASLRRAVKLNPELVEAQLNLAQALRDTGHEDDAQEQMQKTLSGNPQSAASLIFEGSLCLERGDNAGAELAYRNAISLQPQNADALYSLGNVLMFRGRAADARASYQKALDANPNHVRARWAAVMALIPPVAADVGEVEQSRLNFARGLGELDEWFNPQRSATGYEAVGSTQPFYLTYQSKDNRELLARYGALCGRLMEPWSSRNVRKPVPARGRKGPVRLGIASTYFYDHSIWNAIVRGWMKNLDRKRFEIHLFNIGSEDDDETALARKWAHRVEDRRRGLVEWSQCIADSALDILLYPAIGMDILTVRLASQRLAPVQATTWGHPETSGLASIDYYISAEGLESANAQANYTEHLIKLPHLGVFYEPAPIDPVPPDLAALDLPQDVPLLLCPGTPFKYSPEHDHIWVEVARRAGPCRFVFFHPRDAELSNRFAGRLRKAFQAAGISFDRCVSFLRYLNRADYYGLMEYSHLFLDSPGFSGFNTVIQAIECGLPVVTQESPFLRGRLGSGILRRLGLDDLVVDNDTDYINLVVSLMTDEGRRQRARERIVAQRHLLFEDREPIRALQSFVESIVRESS